MCCATQRPDMANTLGRKRTAFRIMAVLFCIAYIVVVLAGSAFILTHLNHDHDHDGPGGSCATCAHMVTVGNLLKQTHIFAFGIAPVFAGIFAVACLFSSASLRTDYHTLVRLNVRLNI